MLAFGLIARVGSRRAQVPLAALVGVCALGAAPPPAHAAGVPPVIQTVPEVQGMRFVANGVRFETDSSGRAYPPAALVGSRAEVRALSTRIAPGARARFDRWYRGGRIAALNIDYRVEVGFVDLEGNRLDPGVVSSVTLASSNGRRQSFEGGGRRGSRATGLFPRAQDDVPRRSPTRSSEWSSAARPWFTADSSASSQPRTATYSCDSCSSQLDSSSATRCSGSRSGPPSGSNTRAVMCSDMASTQGADLTIRSLPRGDYRVSVDALGISSSRPGGALRRPAG